MTRLATLLALPAGLLALVASSAAQDKSWPYNLPRTAKYFPEHGALVSREYEAQEKLAWQTPNGLRKMSDGEKFFLHYWTFDDDDFQSAREGSGYGNASIPLLAPIEPHTRNGNRALELLGRDIFARDFKCPEDTHSCSSTGSDLCCKTGYNCITTDDGKTGCCPEGETCGNEIAPCNDGYTSCPNSSNGGCCIPGAKCKGTGCIIYNTHTITTTLPTATKTTGVSTITSSGKTVTIFETTAQKQTVTETIIISGGGSTTTKTVTVESGNTCTSGFHSCPASLGGGCCRSGQSCASTGCPDNDSTSTGSLTQGIRPTVVSSSSSSSTTSTNSNCPTGYYQCSAHYIGGCCQVARNCDTTSCPPASPSTIISSGATVIQSAPTSVRGGCAGGWYSCPAAESGGCCPDGYTCGIASCRTSRNGLAQATAKSYSSSSADIRVRWNVFILTLATAVGLFCI